MTKQLDYLENEAERLIMILREASNKKGSANVDEWLVNIEKEKKEEKRSENASSIKEWRTECE